MENMAESSLTSAPAIPKHALNCERAIAVSHQNPKRKNKTMKTTHHETQTGRSASDRRHLFMRVFQLGIASLFLALAASGCQSTARLSVPAQFNSEPHPLALAEGDVLRLTFPGASDLNTTQRIRPDGMVSFPLIGEVTAAQKTPVELQQELNQLYDRHLQMNEVFLAVESPVFPIYVSGAVLRPGKIAATRRITALEALMEAGGFDPVRANIRKITVIRNENGHQQNYRVDLRRVLQTDSTAPFYLKPNDILYVPEKNVFF
jgi:polysaccharide biosynthesis/export protein